MKIIAIGIKDEVIISATKDEIANFYGDYSKFQTSIDIKPGIEIQVSPFFHKVRSLNHILKQPEYDDVRYRLKQMIDAITPILELLDHTLIETELKVKID